MATSDLATTLTQCLLLSVIIHASNIEGSRERRQVSEDGWGPWEDKNECSRSCGGGVTYQERHCYENREDGSPMCVGPKRIYSSCNTEDCPAGTKDFRLEQCERYNNISFEDKIYEWVPYYGGENKCELNCLAKGEKFYYRHAAKVVDGTRCSHGALDVCVDGVCQVVGCDKMLGSTIRLDKCHKCGGDGTSCKTRQGELFTDKLKTGYNDVLLIPAGATTINVQEVRASNNYLALRDLHGNYLLNGNWKIDLAQPKDVAGTTFEYERKAHPSLGPESISAPGPIDQPIFIVVLHQPGDSSPVTYEYSIPQDVQEGGKESYSWVTGTWESCSKTCGRGIQVRSVRCESVSDGEMVPFDLCDPESKPQLEQECNDRPCAASWHSGEWAECSTTCGEGVQVRTVFCQRLQHGSVYVIVEEEECTGYRPTAVQTCNHHVKCPKWEVGDWSSCNRVCGPGEEVRSVICRAQHALPNAISDILPEWRCHPEDKPISRQQCNEGPCEGLEWVASRWSGCTMSCDVTVETRHIVCSSKSGKFFPDEMCDMDKKPIHKRQCPLVEGCQGLAQWHASQWSKCSAECGSGIEVRQIICARVQDLAFVKLEDELCDPAAKMPDTRNCTGEECGGLWFTGPWGKCTLPCGGGQRKREVMCFSGNKLVTVAQCDSNTKPDPYEDCNLDPCDEDNLLVIGGCKGTSHGCCPDGITPADGPSYEGCPLKDRIVPGACLETHFGCCLDGITPAQGPFNFGCPDFTCKDTAYGCCKDGQTPSGGHNYEGCPVLFGCEATAYGCCLDGLTPANGLNHEGCGETPLTKSCHDTTYGCCPDGVSPSNGINYDGCEIETSGEICEETLFGCCADGVQAASGPDGQGCNVIPLHCSGTLYGCCPDQVTAAEGPEYQGCVGVVVRPEGTGCSFTVYGCCPDGIMAALGPNGEGCQRIVEVDCATTTFGCCDDRETIALGPNFEGCSTGCEYTDHGCCPDGKTAAIGPNYEGCDDQIVIIGCESTQFGCCPDKVTPADGPNFAGCNITRFEPQCDTTSHGCCPDGQTVAAGANFEGCAEEGSYRFTCRDSPYGCCPDDETQAQGPNNAGCPSLLETGGSCGLASETGPCSNYSVKWFFDPTVGECTRFWYGGCDGNDNRFESREECQGRCMKPEGLLKCYLPRSVGRCRASAEKFYYNSATRQCETFVYGGCQGNDNKFDSAEECEDECVIPQRPDVCAQPHMPGPCRGSFQRWFYDKGAGQCRQFIYGGCKGNDNRFEDREQCDQRCLQPPTAVCQLPADVGPCRGNFVNWYYNPQAKQCEEFVYGGCHGNANRFPTQQDCQSMCKELITPEKTDVCTHAVEAGPCDKYVERFYFDKTDKQCKPFVYGGCQGNSNNFGTMEECSKACHHGDRRPEPESPTSTENRCNMAKDSGPCLAYMPRWYYNLDNQRCEQFIYGGCQGNKNRFMSQEDCRDACTAEIEPEEETRPSEPERPTEREDHRAKCSLPEAPGQCEAYIPSWYYNSVTESCQQFVYGGCDGNDNRFETEADCDKACSKEDICLLSKSPGECKGYFPMWYYHKDNARCEQFIYGGCNGNANRFDNREECEGRCGTRHEPREPYPQPTRRPEPTYRPEPHEPTEEPITGLSACALMSEPGPCRGSLSKWYYDTEEGKCKEFVYGGCRGNENRFDSQYECESTCQVREICSLSYETGPCRAAKRRYFYDSLSGECRQFTYGGCQGNPNRFLSVKSCEKVCQSSVPAQPHYPGHTDICSLPMDGGPCTAYIPSWHYDATDQTCKEFVYGGCVGNDNRFSSRQECQQRCRGEVPTEEPRHVYTEAVTGDVCSLTKDPGPCNGYNPVWYFEPVTRTCRRFLYGGCGGNGNRFDSREDCRGTCLERTVTPRPMSPIDDHHSSEEEENVEEVEEENKEQEETEIVEFDVCSEPADPGPCDDDLVKYFFDSVSGECRMFKYGGCDGNANRYDTEEHCRHICVDRFKQVICRMEPETGSCTNHLKTRKFWYYDAIFGSCLPFTFGGCPTNANRFHSEKHCEEVCLGIKEPNLPPEVTTINPSFKSTKSDETITVGKNTPKIIITEAVGKLQSKTTPPVLTSHATTSGGTKSFNDFLNQRTKQNVDLRTQIDTQILEPIKITTSPTSTSAQKLTSPAFATPPPGVTTSPQPVEFIPGIELLPMLPELVVDNDQCEMPQDKGPCKASILRWYYEATENVCKDFLYGGCRGNDNNFVSKQKCQVVCQKPYDEDTCSLPQDVGPCKALKPHWFFDTASGECALFNYGGCQGNSNRFKTQEECAARCGENRKEKETEESQPEDICKLPRETGPCFADIQKFYYDSVTGECRPFMYGGCQGNKNNFDTQEECYSSCESSFEGEHVIRKPGDCFKPRDKGPCDENEARWYFDTARGDCSPFYYGGCAGNGNNFHSYDDCLAMCSKVTVTCGVLQCDLKCPYGFDRNPTDGCPTCSCYEPCLTIECAENEVCEMEHIACLQEPCPAPTPICVLTTETVKVLVSYPGVCPDVDGESVDRKVDCLVPQCHQDGHCPDGQKCCYNGCVRTCMPFLAQPYEPPVNPSDTSGETEDVIQERQKAEIAKEIEEIGNEIIIIEKEKNKDEMYEKTKEEESKEAEKGDIEVRKESREDIDIKDFIRKKQSEFEAKIKEEIEKEEGKLEDKVKDLIEEEERQLEDKIIEESEKVAVDVDNETKEVVERTDIDTEDKVKDVHEKEESEAKMKVEKAGKCPHVDANLAGICVDQCTQDNDCRGLQKCCSNGCGHTCVQPSQPGCANTVFGCCPDGVTPAGGYNFRGCPEEKPLIEETGSLEISSPLGGTVRLPCRAHGAPAPQITWYKEDFPIMNMNEDARLSQLEDGTLQIEGVTKQDAISYTCRAYNGIGEDTRTYTINVLTAVSFKNTPSVESVLSGQQARLICRADGNPKPSIKWYRNEQAVTEESGKYTLNVDGSLHIEGTTAEDEGDYICEADNGLDAPARKTFNILILEPLTVMITKNNESFVEKSDVQFMCVTQGGGDITTEWTKDKKPLPENPNIRETDGELLIENVEKSDAGSYECTATRGREEAVAVTVLKVEAGSSLPSDCMDKPWLANCVLIIEAQLCSHRYFSNFCCKSCYEAGYL